MSQLSEALEIMREIQARRPTPEQILGPPPWDTDRLEKAYFTDFRKTWELIETLPGHELHQHIECLTRSFALFDVAVRDLIGAIQGFQHLFRERGLPTRRRQHAIDDAKLDVEKNLFAASQAALALVDHSRRISGKIAIPGYKEKTAAFATDPAHQFFQGLRNCLFHVFYISPDWEFHADLKGGDDKARFLLPKKTLLGYDGWNALAKKFLEAMGDSLDLEKFLRDYREKIRAL